MAPIRNKKCCICGKPVWSYSGKYCLNCSKIYHRTRNKHFPSKTIKAIWDYIRKNGYVCYYTGMQLDMTDTHSPWYCVFDHWIPHDQAKVVITSALLNVIKTDLSEKEFWYYVLQLADHRKKHTNVRKRKLVYWERLIPAEDT
jgi:hypothetical protein